MGSISLISSSDTVPGWSAGMQPEKHLGGILWTFPDSIEIRHRHSRAGLIRLLWRGEGGEKPREVRGFTISMCTQSQLCFGDTF